MYEGVSRPRRLDEQDRRYLVFRVYLLSDPVGDGGTFTAWAIVSGAEEDEQ